MEIHRAETGAVPLVWRNLDGNVMGPLHRIVMRFVETVSGLREKNVTIRTKMLDAMQDACLLILLGAAQEI